MPAPIRATTKGFGRALIHALPASLLLCVAASQRLASTVSPGAFEDDRIHVAIPSGWTAQQVTVLTEGDQRVPIRLGEVLSQGKYRLYLLTHYGQTSGILGGRFGEIAGYVAPWIQSDDPWDCFDVLESNVTRVTNSLSRVDLYLPPKANFSAQNDSCKYLRSPRKRPVWSGSFFTLRSEGVKGGFFLSFPLGQRQIHPGREMVFTATFDANHANDLPARGDPHLEEFLHQASAVVRSIQYHE